MTDVADRVLGEDRVLDVVRRHVASARRVVGVDESGGEARAYLVDDAVVLKTQRPHRRRPKTSLEKEAMILVELERQSIGSVPRALGRGFVDDVEYLCLTRIPGDALARVPLRGAARRRALEELGRTLRRFHSADQAAFAQSPLLPGDLTPSDLGARLADELARLAEKRAERGDPTAIARAHLEHVPDDCEPVALHSNPGPTHTFIAGGAFRGVIDFGDAYRSHPALDLCSWSDDADARSVLAGYRSLGALPAGFDVVWRVGSAIAGLTRAMKERRAG